MNLDEALKSIQDVNSIPIEEQRQLLSLAEELEKAREREAAGQKFLPFVKKMWPSFIDGRHHKQMADAFERVLNGELKRLIINMPPRHTKSEFASIHLPAFYLGSYPEKKIIQATHTAELAVGFGRKVRSLVAGEDFQNVFPGVELSSDSKAAGRWSTNKKGEYFAIGVGGAVAGRGADLLVVDDPVDEQTAQYGEYNPEVYAKVWDWYTLLRQRLQPGGSIIIVMTRWSKQDLTGRLVKQMTEEEGTDQWEIIEFPAVMPSGEPLWPEYWALDELLRTKASIPVGRWNAQYQQNPTAEEGALIKRSWWNEWQKDRPPPLESIIMSWDTAFEKTQRADYSACTIWGIWHNQEKDEDHLILLEAFKDKWEFPELKRRAKDAYVEWEPDMVVIEKKASGAPLIYELRQMGIPVTEYTPSRGNDKISRVNSVTDIFASGMVWAPPTRWAQEVVEECAEFPAGEHDDYVDSVAMALIRFRQGGYIRLGHDYDDDELDFLRRRRREYY